MICYTTNYNCSEQLVVSVLVCISPIFSYKIGCYCVRKLTHFKHVELLDFTQHLDAKCN